jgi:SAM-dependent methyltransferase
MPLSLKESEEICERYLPKEHPIPRFFQVRGEAIEAVGLTELQTAYDEIHTYYDDYWVSEAGKPVEELLKKTPLEGISTVVEGGCGTGFATALIAGRLPRAATVTAIDLSEGMLAGARKRIEAQGISNVSFVAGDALEFLGLSEPVDLVLSTWVLGYIPLNPFFNAASRALRKRGFLMFVVHKYNSPREPLEIFGQLVAEDPSALQKRVDFDFPKDMEHIRQELSSAGLGVDQIWEGSIVFRCSTPREALEHLLKSGAGTAYFNAVDPAKRGLLLDQFVARLGARRKPPETYDVIHDYISCVARKK